MVHKKKWLRFVPQSAVRQIRTIAHTRFQPPVEKIEVGPVHFREGDPLRPKEDATASVPWVLRLAAAFSWRVIVVAAAAVGILYLASQLSMILLPVAVALLFSVLLDPLLRFYTVTLKLPRAISAVLTLISGVVFVVVLLTQALSGIIGQLPQLFNRAQVGIQQVTDWVATNPMGIDFSGLDIKRFQSVINNEFATWVKEHVQTVADGAISVTSTFFSVAASTLIMLFVLFFFLKDGRKIWLWIVRLFPAPAREPLHESAIRGWVTLGSYVRAQIQVAAIDALGIGLGAFFLGVPLALPITVVVFFGSFIPIVGALFSGAIAVLVALVDQGPTAGLIMMIIILAVQQIEGNLLQPWIMSSAVSLHPVAVLLVVAGAGSIAGIPGALFGVPIAAFLNSTFLYLHGYDPIPSLHSDVDRPGGPPGKLQELIEASYVQTYQAPFWAVQSVVSSSDEGSYSVEEESPAEENGESSLAAGDSEKDNG